MARGGGPVAMGGLLGPSRTNVADHARGVRRAGRSPAVAIGSRDACSSVGRSHAEASVTADRVPRVPRQPRAPAAAPAAPVRVAVPTDAIPPDVRVAIPLEVPLDLRRTLGIHRRGRGDPALRFEASGSAWRATRTPDGPATLFIELVGDTIRARGWGPGSRWAAERLASLLGLDDRPQALQPRHPAVATAVRRLPGLRIGRTGAVLEALIPAILEQKITGDEARRTYRALMWTHGEPAPGPPGLRVPPDAAALARLPYHAFHPLGLERRRADLIRTVAREAPRLERLVMSAADPAGGLDAAYAVLRAFPGIGPWTAAEVGIRAFGDPDAVSVGDFHLPSVVTWALAGEPRGSDERMLELLEPYRGQRGRVLRLLELAGVGPARHGPRLASRRIADL
jgi:3-methyladenine DNA glycosylase/8-oxoguanine DNA glycosylase